MKYKTHIVFSIFCFLIIDYFNIFNIKLGILFPIIVVSLFSLLPDIDLNTSFIGKKLSGFSKLFEVMFGHRGFFHSLWAVLLLYVILLQFDFMIAILGVIGYLSHIVIDGFNYKGISWFWPLLKIKGKIKTGGLIENILFIGFLFLNIIMLIFLLS